MPTKAAPKPKITVIVEETVQTVYEFDAADELSHQKVETLKALVTEQIIEPHNIMFGRPSHKLGKYAKKGSRPASFLKQETPATNPFGTFTNLVVLYPDEQGVPQTELRLSRTTANVKPLKRSRS